MSLPRYLNHPTFHPCLLKHPYQLPTHLDRNHLILEAVYHERRWKLFACPANGVDFSPQIRVWATRLDHGAVGDLRKGEDVAGTGEIGACALAGFGLAF